MGDEKGAFYVVRKGDLIGVYKSLSACQAQVGSSVSNPSVSVFKGYGLPQKAVDPLVLHGLKNASYVISANDVNDDIFGELVVCPVQPVSSGVITTDKESSPKRSQEVLDSSFLSIGSSSFPSLSQNKHLKSDSSFSCPAISSGCNFCIMEFDGASKGNPGPSGAGAVLRSGDGSIVCRLQEGVGTATNNTAEYRALILGLKQALKRGYKHIRVHGDSKLVCMQDIITTGPWGCWHNIITVGSCGAGIVSLQLTHRGVGSAGIILNIPPQVERGEWPDSQF